MIAPKKTDITNAMMEIDPGVRNFRDIAIDRSTISSDIPLDKNLSSAI